jgi:ubiquinone biosynthesis protein UbiJ
MTMLQAPVAATLNHLLSRQPVLRDKLSVHAGKSARIDAGVMQLNLAVGSDGLLQAADAEPSVTIAIAAAELPLMLANRDRAFSYVSIRGDADFARTISEVANGLQWEAEEDLAPFVGDIAAVRIAQAARETAGTVKDGARKLVENIAEYLLEENPTLLYRRAGDAFAADVAVLRDDVERLTKRIALLEKSAGGGA